MKDLSTGISLEKAFPLTDEAGADTTPYKFKVTNTCNTGIDYNVNIEVLSTSTMAAKNIAVKLDDKDKVVLTEDNITETIGATDYTATEAYHISTGSLKPNESKEHEIRIWMDESAGNDAQNGTFIAKVVISGKQNDYAIYKEPLLHGADPLITGDLVPVIIEEDGTVLKANEHFNWYCYEDKEWANAVILVDKNKKYGYYEEIPESNIESYFVWIPKYRYKLFDDKLGIYTAATNVDSTKQNKAIEIEFNLEDTIDDDTSNEEYKQCATPMNGDKTQGVSGESGQCNVGDWMTHPAFISFDVNGLWVGKFETSDAGGNKVQIKPNKNIWRSTTISNSFTKAKDYNTNLVSHMMKNTEWGAVAYLTQSQYGTCNDTICTEVTQNKNVSYTTGYNTSQVYPQSQNASTTGNNTGIYDMSGGSWEQMASVMANNIGSSTPLWRLSELTEINDKRYYDLYNYAATYNNWERRILGDATGEMGPFQASESEYKSSYFGDYALFVYLDDPWFYRGGHYEYESYAGVFAFSYGTGSANERCGFRIVLAPQESK